MNIEQEHIWAYLNTHANGYNNHKSSDEIRYALQLESGGPTNEHVRDLIRDMILNHGCCIGSDTKGYWIIMTKQELDDVVNSLNNRANGIMERAQALRRNWNNSNSESNPRK